MSHPSSLYGRSIVVRDGRSSANSSLLTPPSIALDEHEAPFKPGLFDVTSLSMKKRHIYGSHHSEATSQLATSKSSNGHFAFDSQPLAKRRSMVDFCSALTPDLFPKASSPKQQHLTTREEPGSRRWTFPSKASSTQGVTTLRSMVRQTVWNEKRASPAIITLRRATAKSCTRRSTELTFFPEPDFGNQSQGLLASFVKTLTVEPSNASRSRKTGENDPYLPATGSSRMRQHLTRAMAPMIQTAITIEPERFVSSSIPEQSQLRRCSTRYVCGGSSYEVVWDDSDCSTSLQTSSRPSTEIDPPERRNSAAASQLETALKRCQETSQASSPGLILSNHEGISSIRKGFSFMLPTKSDQKLARTVHENTLQNLPRSRAGKELRSQIRGQQSPGLISPRRYRTERQDARRALRNEADMYFEEDRRPLLGLGPEVLG